MLAIVQEKHDPVGTSRLDSRNREQQKSSMKTEIERSFLLLLLRVRSKRYTLTAKMVMGRRQNPK